MDIKSRRNELQLTVQYVADYVGVSKSTISKWENGAIKNMKRDKIKKLSKVLKVKPSEIIGAEQEEANNDIEEKESNAEFLDQSKVRSIPVFESVSAGFGAYASGDIVEYIPLYIESDYEAAETLCIKVQGDSMYPKIEDGDTVQVHKQDTVDNGQIAVILVDKEEGLVKRFYQDSYDTIRLESINPEYPPKIFKKEDINRLKIVGLVKKVIKDL